MHIELVVKFHLLFFIKSTENLTIYYAYCGYQKYLD